LSVVSKIRIRGTHPSKRGGQFRTSPEIPSRIRETSEPHSGHYWTQDKWHNLARGRESLSAALCRIHSVRYSADPASFSFWLASFAWLSPHGCWVPTIFAFPPTTRTIRRIQQALVRRDGHYSRVAPLSCWNSWLFRFAFGPAPNSADESYDGSFFLRRQGLASFSAASFMSTILHFYFLRPRAKCFMRLGGCNDSLDVSQDFVLR